MPCEKENPQTLWAKFKSNIGKIAKKHCTKSRGKLAKKAKDLEEDLKRLRGRPDLDTNNTIRAEEAFLTNELEHLK